jgi:hypothetical protein
MNLENEPRLEVSFTYLYPMRVDHPSRADFDRRRQEVVDVMGDDYSPALITRISTMLSGNSGVRYSREGVVSHNAYQENGIYGSVKAITFEAPLTVEKVCKVGRGIGPVAARALISFAVALHEQCEAGQSPRHTKPTLID